MECSRAYSVERHLDQLTIWWNCHATTMDKTSSFAMLRAPCYHLQSQRQSTKASRSAYTRLVVVCCRESSGAVRRPDRPKTSFQFQNLRMGFSLACRGFLKVLLSTSLCGSWARCRVSGWLRALACRLLSGCKDLVRISAAGSCADLPGMEPLDREETMETGG